VRFHFVSQTPTNQTISLCDSYIVQHHIHAISIISGKSSYFPTNTNVSPQIKELFSQQSRFVGYLLSKHLSPCRMLSFCFANHNKVNNRSITLCIIRNVIRTIMLITGKASSHLQHQRFTPCLNPFVKVYLPHLLVLFVDFLLSAWLSYGKLYLRKPCSVQSYMRAAECRPYEGCK